MAVIDTLFNPRGARLREALFPGAAFWAALAAVAIVDVLWLALSNRLSLDLRSAAVLAPAVLLLAILRAYCRNRTDPRLQRLYVPITGALFVILAFSALRVLNHLTMSVPFPYVDDGLAKLDATMGLNWTTYAQWVAERPLLVTLFQLVYTGLTLIALTVFIALFAARRIERAREFVRLIFWSGLSATLIGAFFPAKAAMDRFASSDLRAVFGPEAGVYHLPYLDALRSNLPHVLDLQELPGLVVIPSFHTACALLIMYCCRKVPVLQPLSIFYGVTMIASTPIMGGHYFVDLIAGTALTAAVILADARIGAPRAAKTATGLAAAPR